MNIEKRITGKPAARAGRPSRFRSGSARWRCCWRSAWHYRRKRGSSLRRPPSTNRSPPRPRTRKPPCSQAAASGACRACSSMCEASRRRYRVIRAASVTPHSMRPSAAAKPATRNPCRSRSTPRKVTYGQLLQVYFSVVQDPTELNRQGPDSGTQYRSAMFPLNDAQRHVAQSYIAQLEKAHAVPGADRHEDRAVQRLLSRRVISSELPDLASRLGLYRLSTTCRKSPI